MSSRWGDEKTIHFIRLYRNYECLWNLSSPLYTNKSARDHAYMKIQEDMNVHNVSMTVKDIKNKIKGLRSTYHQELHKIRKANNSPLTCDPYIPTLVWFKEIDFLNDAIQYRKSKSTEPSSQETLDQQMLTHQSSFEIEVSKQPKMKKTRKTRNKIEKIEIEELEQPQWAPETCIEVKMEPLDLPQTDTCIEMSIEPVNQPETSHQSSFEANYQKNNEANTETLDQSEMCSQTNTTDQSRPRPSQTTNSNKRRLVIIKKTFQNNKKKEPRINETVTAPQLENVSTAMNPRYNEIMKDEFYYFGQSVAAQLRTLPLNNALDMQANIQMLLSTERSRSHHSTSYEGSAMSQTANSENSSNTTPYPSHNYEMLSASHYPDTSSDPLISTVVTLQTIPKTETFTDDAINIE